MAWLRSCGGNTYSPLVFPPSTGWTYDGNATGISTDISAYHYMGCGAMTWGQYANFYHSMNCGSTSRTITLDCYTEQGARVYSVYIDGVLANSQNVVAQSVVTFSTTIPAGYHLITLKISNDNNTPSTGNSYIRSVGTT